jgi:F-type H+-transporting ATPase subunit epsilon
MKSFALQIRTPEKTIYWGRALSLNATAADGKIGVLPDHAPLATLLSAGKVAYKLETGEEVEVEMPGGFMIVKNNSVHILGHD